MTKEERKAIRAEITALKKDRAGDNRETSAAYKALRRDIAAYEKLIKRAKREQLKIAFGHERRTDARDKRIAILQGRLHS